MSKRSKSHFLSLLAEHQLLVGRQPQQHTWRHHHLHEHQQVRTHLISSEVTQNSSYIMALTVMNISMLVIVFILSWKKRLIYSNSILIRCWSLRLNKWLNVCREYTIPFLCSDNYEREEYLQDNSISLVLPLKYGVNINVHGWDSICDSNFILSVWIIMTS